MQILRNLFSLLWKSFYGKPTEYILNTRRGFSKGGPLEATLIKREQFVARRYIFDFIGIGGAAIAVAQAQVGCLPWLMRLLRQRDRPPPSRRTHERSHEPTLSSEINLLQFQCIPRYVEFSGSLPSYQEDSNHNLWLRNSMNVHLFCWRRTSFTPPPTKGLIILTVFVGLADIKEWEGVRSRWTLIMRPNRSATIGCQLKEIREGR